MGKTTLAANLAADWATTSKDRILLIDLDFQGSLSKMLFVAAGRLEVTSRSELILDGTLGPDAFHNAATNISLQIPGLPATWLIPAYYSLGARENQLMVSWLMRSAQDDMRYRLSRFLLDDEVRKMFDVVIIDTPPRLTAGTVNALCASTHFLVPSRLDGLSADTVGSFVKAVKVLKNKINPGLEFAGVVGTMTDQQHQLRDVEAAARESIKEQLQQVWPQNPHIYERYIPSRAAFRKAAGQNIAYLEDESIRQLVHELGQEIRQRLN